MTGREVNLLKTSEVKMKMHLRSLELCHRLVSLAPFPIAFGFHHRLRDVEDVDAYWWTWFFAFLGEYLIGHIMFATNSRFYIQVV